MTGKAVYSFLNINISKKIDIEKTNNERLDAFLSKKYTEIHQIKNRDTVDVSVRIISDILTLTRFNNSAYNILPPSKLFIGNRFVTANVSDEATNT